MRKLLLKTMLLLCALIVGSGSAWADEVVAYTLTPATNNANASAAYNQGYDFEISNITWNVTGNTSLTPWRIGGKKSTINSSTGTGDRLIYSKGTISDNISKIVITHGNSTSDITVNSMTLIVSTAENGGGTVISSLSGTYTNNTTTTFERPNNADWTGRYYKIVYNVTNTTTTQKYLLFSEAKFYKETGSTLTASDLSLSPTSLSFDLYNDNSAKTISCTTSSTGAITVSGGTGYVTTSVTGNTITVTPLAATSESQTITVSQAADATYAAGEATFTVSIDDSTPATVYEKVTNANQLVAGNEYILVASTSTSSFAMGSMGSNLRNKVEVTVDNNAVSIQSENVAVLTLGGVSGAWTFLASDNSEYLAYSGSSNQLHSNADATADASKWVVTNDFRLESANVSGRYLQYNSGSPRFACYTGSQTDAFLFVKQGSAIDTKVTPTVTIDASGITNTNVHEGTAAGTLTAAVTYQGNAVSGATVTWSSSEPSVATINASGVITLVAEGTTTITATYAGDDTYNSATDTYTLTVTNVDPNAPGSENNPYTVAQAIENTPSSGTSENVYIRGIVSSFYNNTSIVDDGTNYRYYISDDGTTTTQLLVYKGKGLNNTAFSNAEDLQIGDEVVIYGGLTTYQNASEIASGNYIVNLVRNVVQQAGVIDIADASVEFGTNYTIDTTNDVLTDGTLTINITNPAIAEVVSGTTIRPLAVGSTTITVSSAATQAYTAASDEFTLTVTAPVGKTTALPTTQEITLDFTDNTDWGLPENYTTGEHTYTKDGYTITLNASSNGYKYSPDNTCIIMGKNGTTLTLPAFDSAVTRIDVVGQPRASTSVTQNIYVGNTPVSTATEGATETNTYNIDSEYQAAGTSYTLKVTSSHNTQIVRIIVYTSSAPITATLNSAGYGTFCSEYPLNFSGATNYSAWYIKATSGETITFEKVTGSVKGGTGLFLKGENGTTGEIELTSVNSTNTLSDNMLVGTLAPEYFEEDAIYGLSGNTFKLNYAGTFKANKAYIPASEIDNNGSGVRAFTFVFENPTTGISEVQNVSAEEFGEIFNLAGQRIDQPQKGVNIINGKKVLVK